MWNNQFMALCKLCFIMDQCAWKYQLPDTISQVPPILNSYKVREKFCAIYG
jgi:hypothetical protein